MTTSQVAGNGSHRAATVLTEINTILLVVLLLTQVPSASARQPEPVLRGRALEIVDEQGRERVIKP